MFWLVGGVWAVTRSGGSYSMDGSLMTRDIVDVTAMAFLPPLALLGIGALSLWAIRGFRS